MVARINAPILIIAMKNLLIPVRRVVEYKIHNAIHVIVSNLLTT